MPELSTFQLVMAAAGAVLIFYNINWTAVKGFFGKNSQPALDNKPTDVKIDEPGPQPGPSARPISAVVKEWEDLRNLCVQQGLTSTVKRLDDTFPTFLDLTKEPKEVKNV